MNTKHQHKHHESGNHKNRHAAARRLHKNWRTWAVILMLAAMVVYVLTVDESLRPAGGPASPDLRDLAE